MPARVVTLSTDIGPVYSAQMKGALLKFVPPERVVELTHDLPAHRVGEGAFVLRQMTGAFAPPCVHVAVVDPGVGGTRAALAITCRNGDVLVGPDNGLLIPARDRCGGGAAVRLEPERVVPGATVSATFEGRDLFAPAAGRIASGTPASELGPPWTPLEHRLPAPARTDDGLAGEVLHEDRFGNLISNVPAEWAGGVGAFTTRAGTSRARVLRHVRTYGVLAPGELGIVGSSFGTLELAVREGRAADRLRAGVGAKLRLVPTAAGANRPRGPK